MKVLLALILLCTLLYVMWKDYVTEGAKKKKGGIKICVPAGKKKKNICTRV